MKSNKIFLFILVYNCQNEINRTFKKIKSFYNLFNEIILSNNNDNSLKIIKTYIKKKI